MEQLRQYEVLYKKAKSDFKAAKNLLQDFNRGDSELDMEIIMFHLQQASEKLLKSLLAYNKIHITKTHNIEFLIERCVEEQILLIDNIEALVPLSEYATEGRYAIIHDDMEDADRYIEILEKLFCFVDSKISKDKK